MGYRPGDSYTALFTTTVAGGAAGNADSLPTVVANHNGTDDSTFTAALTVANLDAGRYSVTGTVPAGYAGGDTVTIVAVAVIGGVTVKLPVSRDILDRLPVFTKNKAVTFGFYLPLSSDHVSPGTLKTVTAKRVLDGGAYSAVSGSVTEISNGYYAFAAAAADTNCTSGVWEFAATGCDTQRFPFATEP